MKLYLVQHGEPVSKEVDPERHLSEQGRSDVSKLGELLASLQVEVESLNHSGKTRARETAEILAQNLVHTTVSQRDDISPLDSIQPLVRHLLDSRKNCLVVGHQPFLGKLVSHLLCGVEDKLVVGFQQGGLVCLEYADSGNWSLTGMLLPDLIHRLQR